MRGVVIGKPGFECQRAAPIGLCQVGIAFFSRIHKKERTSNCSNSEYVRTGCAQVIQTLERLSRQYRTQIEKIGKQLAPWSPLVWKPVCVGFKKDYQCLMEKRHPIICHIV